MNHHDDEPSTAALLAIFNRAAGVEEAAAPGQQEHAASAGEEPPEAYADAALAVFERAARGFAGIATAPQAGMGLGTGLGMKSTAVKIGDSLAADLDMVARILAEAEPAEQAATPDPLAAVLARLSAPAAPQAAPTIKPAPLRELPAAVARVLASREARARLPEATREKLAIVENRAVLDLLEQRMTAKHGPNQTGPNGEPLGEFVAAAYIENIAKIYAWERDTGKRLPDDVNPAHRAAEFAFNRVDRHLTQRAKEAARAAA